MDTRNVKAYAPKARKQFLDAVKRRLEKYGITEENIEPCNIQGDVAIIGAATFTAKEGRLREELVAKVKRTSFLQVLENAAYTWFNRFAAIRYMELKHFMDHGRYVLSHPDKPNGFQILDDALDINLEGLDVSKVTELKLDGTKDEELYRELLLAQCKALYKAMPFLFEAIDDATELLLPDNLTSTNSIIRSLVDDIPEEDWADVEIIGWLYQFYISEKKGEVIGKVVKSEDIPAATQLFTPNWIVQYMVQNSIGKQWMMTYPDSALKDKMEYYIELSEQTDEVIQKLAKITPKEIDPELLKVLDPACGSGHILVEAYEVLKEIYREKGYRDRDVPKLILEKNLFGLDIDDRAAQMAGFALLMKAREDDRRIFTKDIQLNVHSIQESAGLDKQFIAETLENGYASHDFIIELLNLFDKGKTFGSLIEIPKEIDLVKFLTFKDMLNELLEKAKENPVRYTDQKLAVETIMPFIDQSILLAQKYDAVVANPPYMGGKGMNADLKTYAKKRFPNSKSDLFAMFMERGLEMTEKNKFMAMITMQSWMFLSSYEKLRKYILDNHEIDTMVHLGARAFPEISGEVVQSTSFVIVK